MTIDTPLNAEEIRVLGCLMEKAMATPEYYPLSLNALTNACNQKSNRDPVVSWPEDVVETAAAALDEKGLVHRSALGRVPKYEETLVRRYNMVAAEAAVLCVLMLRGPQTPGAIRSRCDRLHAFENLEAVQEALERLAEWGLIVRLERLPGHKEVRYTQLLAGSGATDPVSQPLDAAAARTDADEGRIDQLAAEIASLRDELDALKAAFETFRDQFE